MFLDLQKLKYLNLCIFGQQVSKHCNLIANKFQFIITIHSGDDAENLLEVQNSLTFQNVLAQAGAYAGGLGGLSPSPRNFSEVSLKGKNQRKKGEK